MLKFLPTALRRIALSLPAALAVLPAAGAQIAVSDDGTPSYHYPIAVPPGAGGLQPELSLDYTASSVNGIAGYGWALHGVSMISRCRGTIATDGKPSGVTWSSSDRLCLDGKRLIIQNPQNPLLVGSGPRDAAGVMATGAYVEFKLEDDDYSRIRAYGKADTASAAGPAYFRVWEKNGRIVDYGNAPAADGSATDANANILKPASASTQTYAYVQSWAVSRVSDVFGNHLDYKYQQQDRNWGSNGTYQLGHEWWLAEIQYSGNKVIFGYEDRPVTAPRDSSEAYNYGAKNLSIKRLNKITTYVSAAAGALGPGSGLATTSFVPGYTQSAYTGRSLLTSIKQCAGTSSKCLPATTFTYTSGSSDVYVSNDKFNLGGVNFPVTMSAPIDSRLLALTQDFNGDGRTDILRIAYPDGAANVATLYTSNGDGSFTANAKFNITEPLLASTRCYWTFVGDFDGDGLPDLLRVSETTGYDASANPVTCNNTQPTKIFFNNGDGSFNGVAISGMPALKYTPIVQLGSADLNTREDAYQFSIIDVDGDGIADLVQTMYPKVTHVAGPSVPWPTTPGNPPSGCANIVCTHVYKGQGDGSFTELPTNLAHWSVYDTVNAGGNVMDLDGDGLMDLYVLNAFPYVSFTAARSLGDGNFALSGGPATHAREPMDYKGDGRTSLLEPDCLDSGMPNDMWIAESANVDFVPLKTNFGLRGDAYYLCDAAQGTRSGHVIADINGDGRADILRWDVSSQNNAVFLSNGDATFTKSSTFGFSGASGGQAILGGISGTSAYGMLVGDFTGHGDTDIIALQTVSGAISTNVLWTKSVAQSERRPDLLESVKSPLGARDSVVYVPGAFPYLSGDPSDAPAYHTDRGTTNAATGATLDVAANRYLVGQLRVDEGSLVYPQTTFDYYGLKADRNGRGVLGFRQTRRTDTAPDGSTVTDDTYHGIEFPYTDRVITHKRIYATGGSYTLENNIYCDQAAASDVVSTALSTGLSCPIDPSVHVKHTYVLKRSTRGVDLSGDALSSTSRQQTINADGDPLQVTEAAVDPNNAADRYTTITTTTYNADDTSCASNADSYNNCRWILGRPSQRTVEKKSPSAIASTSAGSAQGASSTNGPSGPQPSLGQVTTAISMIVQVLLGD